MVELGSRSSRLGDWVRRRAVIGSALVAVLAVIVAVAAVAMAVAPRGGAAAGRAAERSAALAALAAPGSAGAGGPAALQIVPGDRPSVAVFGSGEASAAAETATVQFIVRSADSFGSVPMSEGQPQPFPAAPAGPTEEELAPIVEAIVAAGVAEGDVVATAGSSFTGPYGPGSGQVVVTLGEELLGEIADVVAAGTEAAGATDGELFVEFVGAAYGVADCGSLEADARDDAVDDARTRAEVLANAVGLTIGDVLLVSDGGYYGPEGGLPVGCADEPLAELSAGKGYSLSPFDPNAPAAVEVYAQLSLAYAIGAAE